MTKLVTAVAVVQLVEKGVLSLDDDVRERLPELKDIQILQSMQRGTSLLLQMIKPLTFTLLPQAAPCQIIQSCVLSMGN